ncbi:hypothetical protein RhiirA4_522312 [Rhizophagus irregularis]|uniref:RING-type domain-containing protein n=1 Tax=Rhizophagus irregularis TaxID=588596 RepID=A0A2I1GL46_9GLOM|nr:hypothetical protein RhiirA4_522312 [Rhizophagus irregularis]
MSTESTCSFNSTDCKGAIKSITNNTRIPITQKEFILAGMKLCQTHYNKFIINEAYNLKNNETCSHPKHNEYKSQSKNSDKKPKNLNLRKVPERLIPILNLDENAKICSLCRKKTDSNPDYNMLEEYNAPISRKQDDSDNILKVGNHTYSFRKDVLYTGEELKQFELDYQEMMAQLTITDEISLSDKIKKMSSVLYKNQRILKQKTIYDPDKFKNMLEMGDVDLIGFFDELYQGTNPNTKSDKTNNDNKKKLVSLCYFLSSINNKYINGIKADIGSYLETSGASASSIDTLANIGLSVSKRTVNRQKTLITEDHQYTVNDYCSQNIENMFILNIDDYHNIHRRNQPTLLKTHDINHFITILLNSNPDIPKIPYYSSNNIPIHNPKGVDFKLIINYINVNFMSKLGKSYYQRNEMWKQYLSDDSYENKLEFLNVHNYDGRVQNQQELRSMKNIFEKIEQEVYLNNFVIPTICDWPGQVNLRRAITLRLNKKENSGISPQILSIIPMIGPLHISLNSREILFQKYHFFFEMIYHELFGGNKILAQKPKPRLIDLILNLTFYGWKNIRNLIINRFRNIKDVEYLMMIDLLDNSLPLTLDIYTKLFKCGFFEGYLESIVKIWILFQRLHRHNYNKAPLIFLSDVFYWTLNDHPILDILKNNLPIFNDYFVENFHSSLRYQTAESNTDKQIIQKAKTIDIERNDDGFKNTFVNTRNTKFSKVKLISLEKKVSLFLLSLFDKIYHNIGKSSNNNNSVFELPSFSNRNVNVELLPLAWSTSNLPDNDNFCDAKNCLSSNSSNIILICGHSYHKECLSLLNGKCKYCFSYLSESIKTNIISLNKRLSKPLKDNEISEFTEDKGLDEDYDDENIDNLLEQEEYNINNQYEIQYNIWLNYNNM